MSGGLTACGVASAVLYPPSGVPPHHGTVQCRFVASCGDRGGIWNIMTSAHMVIGKNFISSAARTAAEKLRAPEPASSLFPISSKKLGPDLVLSFQRLVSKTQLFTVYANAGANVELPF